MFLFRWLKIYFYRIFKTKGPNRQPCYQTEPSVCLARRRQVGNSRTTRPTVLVEYTARRRGGFRKTAGFSCTWGPATAGGREPTNTCFQTYQVKGQRMFAVHLKAEMQLQRFELQVLGWRDTQDRVCRIVLRPSATAGRALLFLLFFFLNSRMIFQVS